MPEQNMTAKNHASFFPAEMQILSGSALKVISVVTMLMDHIAFVLFPLFPWARTPVFNGSYAPSLYRIFRDIGRIAFPIYVFLLVEGFLYTRSRIRYARNLLLFALISELPWNYEHTGTFFYKYQNVYFTLFLGFLGCWVIEYFWEKRMAQFLCLLALLLVSFFLKADYGWKGFIFILIMYTLRAEPAPRAVVGSCWLYYEWKACFAFIPINMYNGKRGFIRNSFIKYMFYAFYPIHILILGLLKYKVFM